MIRALYLSTSRPYNSACPDWHFPTMVLSSNLTAFLKTTKRTQYNQRSRSVQRTVPRGTKCPVSSPQNPAFAGHGACVNGRCAPARLSLTAQRSFLEYGHPEGKRWTRTAKGTVRFGIC